MRELESSRGVTNLKSVHVKQRWSGCMRRAGEVCRARLLASDGCAGGEEAKKRKEECATPADRDC